MVIFTAKVPRGKLVAIALLMVVAIVLLVVLLGKSDTPVQPDETRAPANGSIRTNEDRVAYLNAYGWEVKSEPSQTQEVRIPTDPSDVFERYNNLQISQGFDLHDYAGKTVKRYVYEITNHPGAPGQYFATLLIYKNSVIGGDVCAAEKGGVMHGLAMPDAETAVITPETEAVALPEETDSTAVSGDAAAMDVANAA